MTDCQNGDVRDVLPDYVNDRLGATKRAEVERHLGTCADCRAEVELLRDLRATMRRAPSVNVGAIAAAIPSYRAPVRRDRVTRWRAAAAIAAVIVGGTSIALLRDDSPADRTVQQPPQVAQAPSPTVDSTAAPVTPPVAQTPRSRDRVTTPVPVSTPELAMAGSAIGELSDGELSALVEGLESLDALPTTDVDGGEPLPAGVLGES